MEREDLADDTKSGGKKTLEKEENINPVDRKVRFVVLTAIDKQSAES